MPTNRRRRSRAWSPTLDPFKRQTLLLGPDAVLLAGCGYFPRRSSSTLHMATEDEHAEARAAMMADWRVHGTALTAWWVAATPEAVGKDRWTYVPPGGPGTRPWAWWAFGPGTRRKGESEPTALARLGVLSAEEKARMRWRK